MQPITDVQRLFRSQRASRTFTNEAVPDDLVHQVLTAAIHVESVAIIMLDWPDRDDGPNRRPPLTQRLRYDR